MPELPDLTVLREILAPRLKGTSIAAAEVRRVRHAANLCVNREELQVLLGGYMGILAAGERCISTTNRNFVGRMGHRESEVYLGNPAVAAASAAVASAEASLYSDFAPVNDSSAESTAASVAATAFSAAIAAACSAASCSSAPPR